MTGVKLYEICNAIDEWAFRYAESENGDGDEAAKRELEALQLSLDQKAHNIGCLIKNIEAESAAIAYEIERLKARRESCDKHAARLRNYVAFCLPEGSKWADSCVAFSWRPSEETKVIDALLPDEYWRVKTSREPNKELIKKSIKAGQEIPGAFLVKKMNLQVR